MWKRKVSYRIFMGKPEGSNPLERPRSRWMIILKWIFQRLDGAWTGHIWLRTGTGGRLL